MRPPSCPKHLSREARRLWRALTQQFCFEPDALLTLRAALENWDLAQIARRQLAAEGLVLNGRRHPAVDVARQAYSLYLRAMRQLALDAELPPAGDGEPME